MKRVPVQFSFSLEEAVEIDKFCSVLNLDAQARNAFFRRCIMAEIEKQKKHAPGAVETEEERNVQV